ncbi:MAG: hypothetical protein PHS45_03395 [Bacilli bacterium]|nr:hypothetical protein [Bacilli bacterium]
MENELELTVKLFGDLNEILNHLKHKGFNIIEEFKMADIYMTREMDIYNKSPYELIGNSLLLRNIADNLLLIYKDKQYDENGNILHQCKHECGVESIDKAKKVLESVGYKELVIVRQDGVVMSNGRLEFVVFNVADLGIYLEIEKLRYHEGLTDEEIIKDLVDNLNNLGLKMGTNYYEKKAFDALEKSREKTKKI